MKRFVVAAVSVFFLAACCCLCFTVSHNNITASGDVKNPGLYIIIDPGHGGMDGGTSAADGTLEKHINLQIAQKLNSLLKATGFRTVMLRTDDELIGDNSLSTIRARKVTDIKTRLAIAENHPDSLLISIHQNYYSVSKYYGTQVFYSPNSPLSKSLAESIQNSVVTMLQPSNERKIKAVGTNIYLLYNCTIPSVMVECGFLSNEDEAKKLKTEEYQTQIAFSIMQGIIDFLE